MNVWQLAKDFRDIFAADAAFAGISCFLGQDDGTFELGAKGALVFNATDEPFSADGKAGRFTLNVYVHGQSAATDAVPDPDAAQAANVQLVESKLFGDGKSALMTALNALTRWNIVGWSAGPDDPAFIGMRFETPVICTGTVVEL